MPPRSSAKKEPPAVWFLCEKCSVHLTSKERDFHESQCPVDFWEHPDGPGRTIPCSFIHDRRLYTTSVTSKLPADSRITDLPEAQLNGIVCISESTMSICGLMLADQVVCTSPQLPDDVPVVRTVWPVPDRFGATVFVGENELKSTWKGQTDLQLVIHKLSSIPSPAAHVSIVSCDPSHTIDPSAWNSLQKIIGQLFDSRIISNGSILYFEFFNKSFAFRVTCVTGKQLGLDGSLETQLDGMTLDDRFYIVTTRTSFTLDLAASSQTEPNEDNPIEPKQIALIGGLDATVETLRELMELAFGRVPSMHGFQVNRSVLLYGLPGCGKSLLVESLATESKALVVKLNASDIFSKYFGETEANLIEHFDRAFANYPKPTIIVIEEISNVCAKESKEDSAKRVCSAFLNMLDAVHSRKEGSRTLILSTTSNVENVNPSARRCGRIDVEIEIPVPSPSGREDILSKHFARLPNDLQPEEIKQLSNECHGFVGADLVSLVSKAVLHAIKTSPAGSEGPTLRLLDLYHVLPQVKPSAMREVLIECPNVRWSDIGGQEELKLQLKQAIEWPLTNPEKFLRMGIKPPRGILMFGPPGCSKTMIAKALATESKVNFLSIKGPELFSMWVGESERAVRDLFRKARSVAPAIIFFDEIDAIGGERSGGSGSGSSSSVKERVLAQLLTEMDGVNALQNVTIVAATNRPDLIDKALMRPGRIDRIVYVRLPDTKTREEIFRIKMSKMPVDADVDLTRLVEQTDGYSGAEVQAICQEAALKALEDDFDAETVKRKDFERALEMVTPRTGSELLRLYDEYMEQK